MFNGSAYLKQRDAIKRKCNNTNCKYTGLVKKAYKEKNKCPRNKFHMKLYIFGNIYNFI